MAILKFETSIQAYDKLMLQTELLSREDRLEFVEQLHRACITYANTRAQEAYQPELPSRTGQHNSVIITLNLLERAIALEGGDNEWRDMIGRSTDGEERKQQGDFACYIAYNQAISYR